MVFFNYAKHTTKQGVVWTERWLPRDEFESLRRKRIEQAQESARRALAADPEGVLAARRAYYHANKDRLRDMSREWQRRNRKKCLRWIAAWRARAVQKDPSLKLISNARSRLYMALSGTQKASNTFALLGFTDREAFMRYVERLFQPGMTRANYGKWEVDHIIPCRYFRPWDVDAQRICFHYSNLQPMWKVDNVRKHKKVSAACFDRVCAICPPEHVPYLRALQQKLESAGKLEKIPYASPTHVPAA